ncbi:hypothetical protein OG306_33365 [Streptomyces sp. NBC_01241]|uniref:hypothetical protein n=1 Tax=Streptomyces sp. NBC_01241 TaxID=2903794 RepID=UPI00352EB516|nr:hypothetical protein OG306_33365 [Streptomyces sp. NBC_01241]
MTTRIFTSEELEGIGVPFECDGSEGTAEELHRELWDTTRWAHVYEFVFRAPDDGKAYAVYYRVGATEMQDQDLWNWEDSIEAVEVEEVRVVSTEWKPVKESK